MAEDRAWATVGALKQKQDKSTLNEDVSSLGYVKDASLATVARTGSYNDLSNKPTIPAAQIQSDWNQTSTSAKDFIKNKPTIPSEVHLYEHNITLEDSGSSSHIYFSCITNDNNSITTLAKVVSLLTNIRKSANGIFKSTRSVAYIEGEYNAVYVTSFDNIYSGERFEPSSVYDYVRQII